MDAEPTLVKFVSAVYAPLSGAVLHYDDTPPTGTDVYAVVRTQTGERIYTIAGGGSGRETINWTLEIYGKRAEVAIAVRELPQLLDRYYKADGLTIADTMLDSRTAPVRSDNPPAAAGAVMLFVSEVIQS